MATCRLTAKAAAGATEAALPGIFLVAVRNLMLCTIRQARPWRATLGFSSSLRSVACDRFAVHSAVPAVFELRDYARPLRTIAGHLPTRCASAQPERVFDLTMRERYATATMQVLTTLAHTHATSGNV